MIRLTIACQGLYYLVTGIWPLVSIATFEAVTGPKTDDWLVQTVGVLAAAIGCALLLGTRRRSPAAETHALALLAAAAFAGVDIVFSLAATISPIYLADAVLQIAFAAVILTLSSRRSIRATPHP